MGGAVVALKSMRSMRLVWPERTDEPDELNGELMAMRLNSPLEAV